ncbi:hypothetical protein A4X06_0g2477, partial [Tilletia controversa]
MAAQPMPLMPAHPPPPPPPKRTMEKAPSASSAVSASSWNNRLDAPNSRRTSAGPISADDHDDHFTDADSLYGDPNEPSPTARSPASQFLTSRSPSASGQGHAQDQFLIQTAAAAVAAAAANGGTTAAGMTARQSSYSSSSSSHSGESPRGSFESPIPSSFGAARPFSVSSSIWAGKGALHPSTAARRRAAPPMPQMPHIHTAAAAAAAIPTSSSAAPVAAAVPHSQQSLPRSSYSNNQSSSNPQSPYSLSSPLSDDFNDPLRHSFESSSMYSYMDDDTRAGHGERSRSSSDWRSTDLQGLLPNGTPVPPMPPLPAVAVEGRKSTVPVINTANTKALSPKSSSLSAPSAAALEAFRNRGLRPPPIPNGNNSGNQRRHLLSYAEAEAQEEEELSAVLRDEEKVGGPAANKRLSAMGPKLKKNMLAPWELGDESDDLGLGFGGAGGGGSAGPGAGAVPSFNPFSKRPSTDGRDSGDVRRTVGGGGGG